MKNKISRGLIYLGWLCLVGGLIIITLQIALKTQGTEMMGQEFALAPLPILVVLIGLCAMVIGVIVLCTGLLLRPNKIES